MTKRMSSWENSISSDTTADEEPNTIRPWARELGKLPKKGLVRVGSLEYFEFRGNEQECRKVLFRYKVW